jgi:glycosyltransferase involved in cell wall biosynthesis
LQKGGEDRAVQNEIELLRSKGHEVEILLFSNTAGDGFFQQLRNGLQAVYNRHSYKRTYEMAKAFKPDVVHVHNLFFMASPSILYALHKLEIPVVATLHNYRLLCSNALLLRSGKPCELCVNKIFPLKGVIHRCYKSSAAASFAATSFSSVHKLLHTWQQKVDQFILLTDFAKQIIASSSLKIPESKLIVKPNFTPDIYNPAVKREPFFLFAGRLSEEKGVGPLVQAFQQMPEVQLVIAGQGPLEKELVNSCDPFSNISFAGNLTQPELISYLQRAQALIFPSLWYEGLPFTMIESFAAGTPVLASELGSISTLVEEGSNGLLFKPGSAASIVESVRTFQQTASVKQYNEKARQSYLEKFTPEAGYEQLIRIYKTAIWQKNNR